MKYKKTKSHTGFNRFQDGLTALHIACNKHRTELARLILEAAEKQHHFCTSKSKKKKIGTDAVTYTAADATAKEMTKEMASDCEIILNAKQKPQVPATVVPYFGPCHSQHTHIHTHRGGLHSCTQQSTETWKQSKSSLATHFSGLTLRTRLVLEDSYIIINYFTEEAQCVPHTGKEAYHPTGGGGVGGSGRERRGEGEQEKGAATRMHESPVCSARHQ